MRLDNPNDLWLALDEEEFEVVERTILPRTIPPRARRSAVFALIRAIATLVAPVPMMAFRFLRRRLQQTEGRPTFMGRVGSYVVGHMIISTITTVIGFNFFALLLAIPLWLMGWKVELPGPMKSQVRGTLSRARDALRDEKEELRDRLHDEREELEERWRHAREEARERLDDADLAGRARRAGRKAAWHYITD